MFPTNTTIDLLLAKLENAKAIELQSLLNDFYKLISQELNFPIKQIKFHSNFAVCYFDMSKLRIEVGEETPFYFIKQKKLTDKELADAIFQIKSSLYQRNLQEIISFLFVIGNESLIKDHIKDSYLDIVIFNKLNLSSVLRSEQKLSSFIKFIREQHGISILSPYSHTRIPIGSMFYGRKEYIQKVIRSQFEINFAIVGSRRIGKTSLLLNLKKYLDANSIYHTLFFDCYRIRNNHDFVLQVASELDVRYSPKIQVSNFYGFIKRIKSKLNKKLIFLLDEFDDLLTYDKTCQWVLSRNFHALALEDLCKIIVAGFRTLHQEINNHHSPFFKYFEPISIKQLDDEAASRLILEPLHDLGIKIVNRNIFSKRIMSITSNHPHFIQFFCSKLIEIVNKKNINELSTDDVVQVESMDEYYHFLVDTLIVNTDEFQQLIVYEMIDADLFDERDILESFKRKFNLDLSLMSIQKDCIELELANILTMENKKYKFSYPALPNILKTGYNLEFKKNRLVTEIISKERFYAK